MPPRPPTGSTQAWLRPGSRYRGNCRKPRTARCCWAPTWHADNILAAQREPWLVIDPKPYVGDPAYKLLQHMLNCHDRLAADRAGLANRMADLAGLDARRVRQWLLARSVQRSIGSPLMCQVASRLASA